MSPVTGEPYFPPETWVVVLTPLGANVPDQVLATFDQSADDQAGLPFDQQTAEQLAANINHFSSDHHAVAVKLEATLQPGD